MAEKRLRPVVAVVDGAVVLTFPGCGTPVVVDLDEMELEAEGREVLFAVGVDDAEIVETTADLEEALKAAGQALERGAWKVDLEVMDEEGNVLDLFTLYEEDGEPE